ncbi:MAG: hypothetical protein QOG10_4539, partial [Kribbellaceae bacterium]|nr:hypothetical protein [Kribbellaceae bacterium]
MQYEGVQPNPLGLSVSAAAGYLRKQGAGKVVLVGVSMGGTASIAAAAITTPRVDAVVSLSASAEYDGIDARTAAGLLRVPVLYGAAADDKDFADASRLLHAATKSQKSLHLVPGWVPCTVSPSLRRTASRRYGVPSVLHQHAHALRFGTLLLLAVASRWRRIETVVTDGSPLVCATNTRPPYDARPTAQRRHTGSAPGTGHRSPERRVAANLTQRFSGGSTSLCSRGDDSSDLREHLRALETDLELYPDERLDLLLEIAGVHRKLGDHDRAVGIWQDLIAEGGEDGDYARVEFLDHLFHIARSDEARAELSALKAGRRTSTGAWQIAAELLQERGELDEALTWLTMATERLTQDELVIVGSDAGWASQPGMLVRNRRKIRAEIGLPPDLIDLLVPDEDKILALLRKPFPSLDEAVDAVRANGLARTEVRMLFWPRAEFQTARKRWHEVIDADV